MGNKVHIRKAAGAGKFGVGYIVKDGKLTLDEIVTDYNRTQALVGLPQAKKMNATAKAFTLFRAIRVAWVYAQENGKKTTPFIAKWGDSAGLKMVLYRVDKSTAAAAAAKKALDAVLAVAKSEGVDIDHPETWEEKEKNEIMPWMERYQDATRELKEARADERKRSADLESTLVAFRAAEGNYAEHENEATK